MQSYRIDKIFKEQYLLLNKRLKNSITAIDYYNWMQNFETTDRDIAYKVLGMVEYIDDTDILTGFEVCINELLSKLIDNQKIIVNPVGGFQKSGNAMYYFFWKSVKSLNVENRFKPITHSSQFKRYHFSESDVLLLIDDFIGSGRTVTKYYDQQIKHYIRQNKYVPTVFIISIISLVKGMNYLGNNYPEIELICWKTQNAAFSKNSSPFGYREKMLPIREMSYRYGKKLNKNNPLGYNNSQALVTFSYGTPNNTLPIIWSSLNGWYPLYPRFPDDIISQSKRFRKETAFYLSMANSLGNDVMQDFISGHKNLGWKEFNFITKTDFQLFSILRLRLWNRPVPIICQILGISIEEYSDLIAEGRKRDLIDSDGDLTSKGREIYKEIQKYVTRLDFNPYLKQHYNLKNKLYVPKIFQGKV